MNMEDDDDKFKLSEWIFPIISMIVIVVLFILAGLQSVRK